MSVSCKKIQSLSAVIVMTLLSFAVIPSTSAEDDFEETPAAETASEEPPPPIEEAPPAEEVQGTLTSPEDAFGDANSQLGSIPAIEAKIYDIEVIRPSKSSRVYLFQKASNDLPEVGRIFLLKDSAAPVMAFRVLKTYPDTQQVAAKKVREYPNFPTLAPKSRYRAYEKKGNLSVIRPSNEDQQDLMDLEQTPPPTEELTGSLPATEPTETQISEPQTEAEAPPAESAEPSESAEPTSDQNDPGEQDVEIKNEQEDDDDYGSYDYFPNWLTVPFGMYLGNAHLPGPNTQKGTGLLYGRNLGSRSFSLEGGFYYYKAAGDVAGVSKSFTMMPIVGTGRFNFALSENVIFFIYGGLQYKWVIGNIGANASDLQKIGVVAPVGGIGTFVQIGPNWFLRISLGIDSFLGGIVLRF